MGQLSGPKRNDRSTTFERRAAVVLAGLGAGVTPCPSSYLRRWRNWQTHRSWIPAVQSFTATLWVRFPHAAVRSTAELYHTIAGRG